MQPYVIILAATPTEGAQYARRADLPRGRHRYAASAHAIRGLQRAHLHVLPSFATARNRHAIEAELRWGKHERFNVTMPEVEAIDQGDGMGQQLTIEDMFDHGILSYVADASLTWAKVPQATSALGEPVDDVDLDLGKTSERGDDDPVAPVNKARRRSRCKVCNVLTLGPDDPAHDGSLHDATQLTDRPTVDLFGGTR